jgi:site-specific recombinase XerD
MSPSNISHWHPAMPPAQNPVLPTRNKSNSELAYKFGEWLVAQRFSRSAYEAYTKVAFSYCHFIGQRHVSRTNHLDVRYFSIDLMKRDLTVDGYNRHLYALRRFVDFLYMGGVVDAVAPRLVRGKRHERALPAVVSVADVGGLVKAAGTVRNQTRIELLYATGCRVGALVRIRIEGVDRSRRTIQVAGKGKERTVFFGALCPTVEETPERSAQRPVVSAGAFQTDRMHSCTQRRLAVALARLFEWHRTRTQDFDVPGHRSNLATREDASQAARTKIEVRLPASISTSANSVCGKSNPVCRTAGWARSNHAAHDSGLLCNALAPSGGGHSPHSRPARPHVSTYDSGLHTRC